MTASGKRLPEILAIILAFLAGLLAFVNYFFAQSFLSGPTQFLLKTVVLVSGAALLMAALRLLWRHAQNIRKKDVGSSLLVAAFLITFIAGVLPGDFQSGVGGWLYHWLLAPGMAAIFALLPIFLAYALYRHLNVRELGGFLLFLGLITVLLGQIPSLISSFPLMADLRYELLIWPAAASFRGIILGLAVGVIVAIFLRIFASAHFNTLFRNDEGDEA